MKNENAAVQKNKKGKGKVTEEKNDEEEKYLKPLREPTENEKRNMLAKSVEIMIIQTLENHVYKFGNQIRRQNEGGPIGLALTGEIADWDKEYLKKLAAAGINPGIYERFKDDITILLESVEPGVKFDGEKLFIDNEKKLLDEQKSDEEITMEIVKEIANSVDDMTKFTVDYPSNHECGKMPILDVEAGINKEKENLIEYEFYEKPTKNKFLILSDSAIASKQKRTILTQECLRRLRNTQIGLGREVQIKHLNKYMVKMKNSGYKAEYRRQILNSSDKAFTQMVKDDQMGVKPLFRDKNWNKESRKKEKETKRKNWYKEKRNYLGKNKVEYTSVLIVPVTKGGTLVKELQEREEEVNKYSNERVKMIEDAGLRLKDILVDKNPFPNSKCEKKKKCFICDSNEKEDPKIPCNSDNVGYRLECDTCFSKGKIKVYEGETGRSARIRAKEHMADFKNKRQKSVLFKHKENDHKHEEMHVKMKITQKFTDPLTRQANEAVRISNRKTGELLNSKSEFHHPPVTRITVGRTPIGMS